ncbi:bifunctional folylpolyglutamate synthase/dihydrofolate synthase [Micavibrio aeruginosavorus]|uniref:Dihydrofolate synthase/folylpolyglutamate synthase n=1 Tax=Micavibrio aeruginosavorus (strain ARL-13) TaxID=856793 RepID=G2KMU8_MICAA|nr:folylpolyglutamate synthase/dihydrofolate synthase family protein [Micavibrio aeruginosavorus]AEP08485.1 folC bifunctional family protein [Micavibrio aeruginosavorus ARL-13]
MQDTLNHIFSLRKNGRMDHSIRPEFFTLLDRLGNPHTHLPPVIHVAGTNGKGSTIAFMRAMLEAAGHSVHAYTSPHLIRFNERIVLNGQVIDDARLKPLLDEVLAAAHDDPDQSFFEIATAAAFTAFARTRADIVLLETGVGGRLDATNVVEHPIATAITTLSFDHTAWLGERLENIAAEKAGIIKPGVPCVVGAQMMDEAPAAIRVIETRAAAMQAALTIMGRDWHVHDVTDSSWSLTVAGETLSALPRPAMAGAHQIDNAALAIATLRAQSQCPVPIDAIHHGLRTAHWPGRLHRISHPAAPASWDVWVDGAHNDSGAIVLARHIAALYASDGHPTHLIIGMMGHKDAARFIAPLAQCATSVTLIPVPGSEGGKSHDPATLVPLWRTHGARNVSCAPDLDHAIATLAATHAPGRIIVAGSLYLAGHTLAQAAFS